MCSHRKMRCCSGASVAPDQRPRKNGRTYSAQPKTRKCLRRATGADPRHVKRARIVLLAAEGRSTRSIAEEVGVQPRIVSNWRRRFAEHGIGGLQDRPRAGKKPIYGKATNKRILALLDKPPPQGYARWTGPLLAKALGDVDVQYVWRFLREPLSTLPPASRGARARPFVRGESRRCGRALCRSARQGDCSLCRRKAFDPGVGACARLFEAANGRALTGETHDYKRHGTTTLFAALEVATGRIIAAHSKLHRRVEFLGFMNSVVAAFPGRELHVILDNLNTHKKNQRWLKKHPTVHFHFTPTRSSWLNQIETWFSILQGQSLNGASFTAIEQLQEHIDAFIAAYNETAEPFAWTKKKVYQRRFKNRRITQLYSH